MAGFQKACPALLHRAARQIQILVGSFHNLREMLCYFPSYLKTTFYVGFFPYLPSVRFFSLDRETCFGTFNKYEEDFLLSLRRIHFKIGDNIMANVKDGLLYNKSHIWA